MAGVVGSSVCAVCVVPEWPELKLDVEPALRTERCINKFVCADAAEIFC